MQQFLKNIEEKAKKCPARIVFPEGEEERIIQATIKIVEKGTAKPILIGNPETIKNLLKNHSGEHVYTKITIVDNHDKKVYTKYAKKLFEARKYKGMTEEESLQTIQHINYLGTVMVNCGDADGMISGTTFPTADTIRPALQIIKTKEKFHKVSGMFIMVLDEKILLFADCAITINPNSHDLAAIAIDTAETAERFKITPKIAMLSFSTHGSAKHPAASKVAEATALIKDRRPDLIIDGEMQIDAALVPEVAAKKYPNSSIAGDANVLIFPDLNSGNIAYKLVQRLAGAQAIGPILQGLKKPVNDLSRGCSVQDIVNLAAITSLEASNDCFK